MKVGDNLEVTIAGMVVAAAEITEVDNNNNTVTIVIPPTQVIMQTATTVTAPKPPEPAKETIITGVDGPPAKEVPSSEPVSNPADTADVGGQLETVETSAGTETVNTE